MASRSVNKVILVGHLGRDAETKFTPSGTSVTNLRIATSRRWKDQQSGDWKEETDWHSVTLWRAENLAQYLTKGKQVYVEGRLQNRQYQDKDGNTRYATDVVADDIILLSGSRGGGDFDSGGGAGAGDDYSQEPRMVSMPRNAGGPGGGPGGRQGGPAAGGNRPQGRPQPQRDADPFDQGISDDDVPF